MAITCNEIDTEMKLLDTRDLRVILHVGKNKAYNIMHSDCFPSFKLGRTWVVREGALREWLKDSDYSQVIL